MCAKSGQSCYCKLLVTLQRLPHLTELDLSNNGLSEMPDILTADILPILGTLRMTGNQLESLPMGMLQLPRLKVRVMHVHLLLSCIFRLKLVITLYDRCASIARQVYLLLAGQELRVFCVECHIRRQISSGTHCRSCMLKGIPCEGRVWSQLLPN